MYLEECIEHGASGGTPEMSDGGIPDHGSAAHAGGGITVQVFDRGECRGYQYHRDLLRLLAAGGAFLFKGRGKPPVYLGDAGGSGLFSGHMRSFCCGGSRFFTGQQRVHHDSPDLPRQRDAGRDAGIRWIYKNFVKNLSFLSKYVILVK